MIPMKGSNFSSPCKYLVYADYLISFELFYRNNPSFNFEWFYKNICNLGILSNVDLDFVWTRTKETTLSTYRNYNNNVPQHLSKGGILA